MICENCNTQNPEESKYCSECGAALASSESVANNSQEEKNVQKPYKALRIFNWLLAVLLIGGVALFIVSAKEVSPLVIGMLAFLVLILANYIGTAVLLNPGVSMFFGVPILLSVSNKAAFYALVAGNSILSLLGLGIIVASLSTNQYGPSLSGFLYLFLSLANIRALWQLKKA